MVLHQDGVQELPGIQELLILLQCGNQSQHDVRYYIYYLVLIVIKPFCWLLVLTGFNPNFSSSNVWIETSVMSTWTFCIFQEFNQLWSVTTLKTCIILYACKLILNLNDDDQIRQLSGAYRIGQEKTDNFVGKHFYIVLDYACSIFFLPFIIAAISLYMQWNDWQGVSVSWISDQVAPITGIIMRITVTNSELTF